MNELYAPQIAEIKKALDNKISEEVILKDLEKLIKYRVPLSEAKRSIIKKYGGTGSIKKTLSEIAPDDKNVEITVKILEVNGRNVDVKGVERTILVGILADNTAQIPFTSWTKLDISKGDVVNIKEAYVRSWQNQLQINLGERCEITKQDENTIGEIKTEITPTKLAEIRAHSSNIHTQAIILESKEQTVNTKEGNKTIINGILADETAKLPFTSWTQNPLITTGNTIRIENAYTKPFRGIPTINISEETIISKSDQTIPPLTEPLQQNIHELLKRDGALDVITQGNILSIRPGSGLIMRCPECKRVIQKNTCRVHGIITPTPDMRVKAVIDDGTAPITLMLNMELTEELWGNTIEDAKKMAVDAMSPETVEENIREKLLGKRIKARGNMSNSEYGASIVAESAEIFKEDLTETALTILKERGEYQ